MRMIFLALLMGHVLLLALSALASPPAGDIVLSCKPERATNPNYGCTAGDVQASEVRALEITKNCSIEEPWAIVTIEVLKFPWRFNGNVIKSIWPGGCISQRR